MTLHISGTNLRVKTRGPEMVFLSGCDTTEVIPIKEFLAMVSYVLTNTNVVKDDPRLAFIESVRKSTLVEGYPTIIQGEKVEGEERVQLWLPPEEKSDA